MKDWMKYRRIYKEKGLCTKCGKERDDPEFMRCSHCREILRNYHYRETCKRATHNMRRRRKENGLCSRCGRSTVNGTGYCEKCKKEVRDYRRSNFIGTTNKIIKVKKRPYPEDDSCELCGERRKKYLVYHHWDDKRPELGIWICVNCHTIVGYIEKGKSFVFKKYTELKSEVNDNANLQFSM